MLSFDEFRAKSKRDKSRSELSDNNKSNISPVPAKESIQTSSSSSKFSLGNFIEGTNVQIFILIVILLDTIIAFIETGALLLYAESSFRANKNDLSSITLLLLYITQDMLLLISQGFNLLCLSLLSCELLTICIIFQYRLLFHLGYLIDIIVITCQLYSQSYTTNKLSRILNIFRIWRIIRLINTYIEQEQISHDMTKSIILDKDTEIAQLQLNILQIRSDMERVEEARGNIEAQLLGYKEEIDTLNEALKIAAMDIAEVGEDADFAYDDEEEDDEIVPTSGQNYDPAANEPNNSIDKGVIESKTDAAYTNNSTTNNDNNTNYKSPGKNKSGTSSTRSQSREGQTGATIVINADGSYENTV